MIRQQGETGARFIGDDQLAVDVADSDEAQALATALRRTDRWLEVVAGVDSVTVQFDAAEIDPDAAAAEFAGQRRNELVTVDSPSALLEIPVRYGGDDGPDLEAVCAQLGMTRDEFIAMHTACEFRVQMLGFTPGFAYVGGEQRWQGIERLASPRQHVAAGSIGIAAGRSGIYALAGPGGWPLIGRTRLPLFDASSDEPFVLQPGSRIRFVDERPDG